MTGLFAGNQSAVAVGRFDPAGPSGFIARSAPSFMVAALRPTRAEAEADDRAWRGAGS